MSFYILISVCILMLALCGALEEAGKATGISKSEFCFGALLVCAASPFTLQIAMLSANAAAILFPLFWCFQANDGGFRAIKLYPLSACFPLAATLIFSMTRACIDMYFAPVFDITILNMELILWAVGVFTETLFYINNKKSPVQER